MDVVAELLGLQKLLGQILEVSLGELNADSDLDLVGTVLGHNDVVSEDTSLTVDLDAGVQKVNLEKRRYRIKP